LETILFASSLIQDI